MKLSGKQIGEIQEALLDAYPTRDDLRIMVRIELEQELEAIADGANQRVVIFNLISWAERTGRIDDLVQGAYRQNQGNPALQKFLALWRTTAPSAADQVASRIATSGPVSIDLFLSYSRKDDKAMHQVQAPLRAAGFSVWTDEGLAPGTQSWKDAISEAVDQAQAMVVLLSPNSAQSTWVKNEISFAQAHAKRIFPVLIAGDAATAVPIDLINAQWVDGRKDLPQAVKRDLLPELRRHFHLPELAPPPPSTTAETKAVASAVPAGAPVAKKGSTTWNRYLVIALIVVIVAFVGVEIGRLNFFPAPTTPVPAFANPTSSPTEEISKTKPTSSPSAGVRPVAVETPLREPTYPPTKAPTDTPLPASITPPSALTLPEAVELEAGATQTNPKDGAEYVYVPFGPFTMGSTAEQIDIAFEVCQQATNDTCNRAWFDAEAPQSEIATGGFSIMRTEVTNAQYARCVQAGVCTEPSNTQWNDAAYAEHPVTYVDWFQANEYAQWVGGRLPTEAEWEKACRGIDGRIYPWGDDQPTSELANFNMNVGNTTPVGSYPEGASPYGVLDMAGNVWEWTSSKSADYPYVPNDGREDQVGDKSRVLRGGSFSSFVRSVRCAARVGLNPLFQDRNGGFRVVLSP